MVHGLLEELLKMLVSRPRILCANHHRYITRGLLWSLLPKIEIFKPLVTGAIAMLEDDNMFDRKTGKLLIIERAAGGNDDQRKTRAEQGGCMCVTVTAVCPFKRKGDAAESRCCRCQALLGLDLALCKHCSGDASARGIANVNSCAMSTRAKLTKEQMAQLPTAWAAWETHAAQLPDSKTMSSTERTQAFIEYVSSAAAAHTSE
jgi:hypothetical protein